MNNPFTKVKDMSDEQLNITIQKQGKYVFVPAVTALIIGFIAIINSAVFGINIISAIDIAGALGFEGVLCSLSAVIYSYLLYCKTERRIRDVASLCLTVEESK